MLITYVGASNLRQEKPSPAVEVRKRRAVYQKMGEAEEHCRSGAGMY